MMRLTSAFRPELEGSLIAVFFGLVAVACTDSNVRDEYAAFINRADRTSPYQIDSDAARGKGQIADIAGEHILNVDLNPIGAVRLRLRASILTFEYLENGARVTGEFRLADSDPDIYEPTSPPLATFESDIEEDGFMELNLGRVYVPSHLSPIPDTGVDVVLNFKAIILNENQLCGFIDDPEVTVIAPALLGLAGTTFGSQRLEADGSTPKNIPNSCPFDLGLPNFNPPPAEDPDALTPPGLNTPYGQQVDIGGRFFMRTALAGTSLVLDFILDGQVEPFEHGNLPEDCIAINNGSDRLYRAELRTFGRSGDGDPNAPPVGTFCSQISRRGLFNAVVLGLVAPSPLGDVNADIALSAVTIDQDAYCAVASGRVTSPLHLNLAGTTIGFVRMDDDAWERAENPLAECPPVQAEPPDALEEIGHPRDITGRWFFNVQSADGVGDRSLTLHFIGDLRYLAENESTESTVVDAILRRFGADAGPTDPAIGLTSGNEVDQYAQFNLYLDGVLGRDDQDRPIEGNLAMRAVIREDHTLCGLANGRILRPFQGPFSTWRFSAAPIPDTSWQETESLPDCNPSP